MANDTPSNIIRGGRMVLHSHPVLRASWHGFLHHLDHLDATDRRRFIAYVRLVYGTTGHVTLPVDGPPTTKDAETEEPSCGPTCIRHHHG